MTTRAQFSVRTSDMSVSANLEGYALIVRNPDETVALRFTFATEKEARALAVAIEESWLEIVTD